MVQHPGLVRVHDYQQTAAGNAYIVMEFLQGESLAARIEAAHQLGHGLPLPRTLHIGGQVAAALAAAPAQGVPVRRSVLTNAPGVALVADLPADPMFEGYASDGRPVL